jgi:hypothetical protein
MGCNKDFVFWDYEFILRSILLIWVNSVEEKGESESQESPLMIDFHILFVSMKGDFEKRLD